MSTTINSTMNILRSLRKITEGQSNVVQKLEKIVELVAKELSANVCACYILIDNNYLELFASYGFQKKDIAHKVSLKVGEGLLGAVAQSGRSLVVADAWSNPSFVYKPEVDEKELTSFIGVPLIRRSKCIGVLTLQNKVIYEYTQVEIELLETIAMVLSELVSSDEMTEYKKSLVKSKGEVLKDKIKGLALSKGYGLGSAVVHRRRQAVTKIFADDKEKELLRLNEAYERMLIDLDEKFAETKLGMGDHVEILEAYKMFAADKGWFKKIAGNVESGMTAEASIERTFEDMHNRLSGTNDAYLKERLHDLRDVSDRLQSYLIGDFIDSKSVDAEHLIIVAQTMGPADLMDYDYHKIRGLIIEDGTPTMHVSIVAKALNIPVIAKVKGLFEEVKNGDEIAIDGNEGYIYISPSKEIKAKFEQYFLERRILNKKLDELKGLPSKTLDGTKIGLYINVGLAFDFDYLESTNCDGVGLYRTEIPFMASDVMPDSDKQLVYYKDLMDKAKNKKVVFRSLDVGSDKLLPYWSNLGEDNPAIGWRSIRITLDRRAILKKQLKAFIRACDGKELNVMFPMISNLSEFEDSKETLMLELEKERKKTGLHPAKVNVGLMIEVPSIVFQLDAILKVADFISVGTNDLAQFVFACDRGNPKLLERYDVLSAPFLKILKEIIDKANKYNVYASVCGEMSGNPIEAMALIGLGYRNLSMSGSSFGKVKNMIRTMKVEDVTDYVNNLLESNKRTLRPQLMSYAYDHAIEFY